MKHWKDPEISTPANRLNGLNGLNRQTGPTPIQPYNSNLPSSSPGMRQISGNNCFEVFRRKKLLTATLFSETFRISNCR
jgi:hypothetical protein